MKKKLYFLDIDGTLALGKTLIPGAASLIEEIHRQGAHCCYLTNNSSKGIDEYLAQFEQWGIPADREEFMTAGIYVAKRLKAEFKDKKIFVLGTESFLFECRREGLCVTQEAEEDVAAVLMAYDTELTYEKIRRVCRLLEVHRFIRPWYATNADLCCPSEFGMVPDCGAISKMISLAVGREPEFLGKPDPGMIDYVLKQYEIARQDAMIVGDRLYTDIECGKRAGIATCLVLTGEETEDSEVADHCFLSVEGLAKNLHSERQSL
ncbi:MAG: HAD-IIA family hydrolase [Lachnospiraceae bacterium]|nr:HAD-IIA family hydrolase [Lachnospiraceae bacterium]